MINDLAKNYVLLISYAAVPIKIEFTSFLFVTIEAPYSVALSMFSLTSLPHIWLSSAGLLVFVCASQVMLFHHEGGTVSCQIGFRCFTAAVSRLLSLTACFCTLLKMQVFFFWKNHKFFLFFFPAVCNVIYSTTFLIA